jgi:ParB-like chromosome segregation protein Spo0J
MTLAKREQLAAAKASAAWFQHVLDSTGFSPYEIMVRAGLGRSNLQRYASGTSKTAMSLPLIRAISAVTGVLAPHGLLIPEGFEVGLKET